MTPAKQIERETPHIGSHMLSARDVADIVWLAAFLDPPPQAEEVTTDTQRDPRPEPSQPDKDEKQTPAASRGESEQTTAPPKDGEHSEPTPYPAEGSTAQVYGSGTESEDDDDDVLSGIGIKTPRAPALLEKADLIRSLRPLQRRVPSEHAFELDERATAANIAAALVGNGSWTPVQHPVQERWLDLVFLVDVAPSMELWRRTADELVALCANTGIFRDVQRWDLVVVESEGAINDERSTELHLYPGQTAPGMTPRRYATRELIDQQQQRLFLVVTDCSSIVWDSGAAQQLLQPLAERNVVSIIQMLPENLWETTALKFATETRLRSRQPLASNAQLVNRLLQHNKNFPLPVVSLEAPEILAWATFIAGRGQRPIIAVTLPEPADEAHVDVSRALVMLGIEPQPVLAEEEMSVETQYAAFRANVPRTARYLAYYFAAAPLTVPVMHMVRAALLPRSTHADFVRVFYSGLLRRTTAQTTERIGDDAIYDFVGGDAMREHLLNRLPRASSEAIVDLVIAELSRYVEEHIDELAAFDAVIAVEGVAGMLQVDAKARHFAEVTAKVLRYLGGAYAELADNLAHAIRPEPTVEEDGDDDQATALVEASTRSWQRVTTTANQIAEALGESVVSTKVPATEDGVSETSIVTRIQADGDVQQFMPSDVDATLRNAHEASVATFQTLQRQMLAVLAALTPSRLAAPGPEIALPHIVAGADPLALDWCWVPGGPFTMGGDVYDREKPVHQATVDGFWIARAPVTNAQYRLFMEAGGYEEARWWTETGWQHKTDEKWSEPRYWQDTRFKEPQQPVVGVSWYEATAFCVWAAATTGEPIRLPTEVEWEKAARSSDGRPYPWGKAEPNEELCNFSSNVGQTTPVGQYSPQGDSRYGCVDMAGNVFDWTDSWFKAYPGNTIADNSYGETYRVVRGGSWYDLDPSYLRCAYRRRVIPLIRFSNVGFRCASTAF